MKSVKVLACVALCVAVLIVSGWQLIIKSTVGAQQPAIAPVISVTTVATVAALPAGHPCDPTWWKSASDQLATQWQQAGQAKESSLFADAAQQYLAIADLLPESRQAMDAILKAASCKRQADSNADAIGLYDRAIAIGNKYINIDYGNLRQYGWNQRHFKDDLSAMKPLLFDAMCGKAQAYYDAGNNAECKRTLDALRATFTKCEASHLDRVYPLEAKLSGKDASVIYSREKAAGGLFDEAYSAFRSGDHSKTNGLIDNILAGYPQTAAVLRAMDLKARMLWENGSRTEATSVYSQIAGRTKDVAPECEFARIAGSRIAVHNSRRLYFRLMKQVSRGESVAVADCQQLRDLCREADRANRELIEVIQNHTLIAVSYYLEGQYAQAVQVVDDAFRDHYLRRCEKVFRLKAECAALQFWAGRALAKLGQCQDAHDRFNRVIQSINPQAVPSERGLAAFAYYWTWKSLGDCEGCQNTASEAGKIVLSQYSETTAARQLRQDMR